MEITQSETRPIYDFASPEKYQHSSLRLILELIFRGEVYSQQAVDANLIHSFIIDLIPSVSSSPFPSLTQNDQNYYLKHADDKGDHILVDNDFNIAAIIDWEWAYTAPAARAFNSPIGLPPVGDFYDGSNDLGDDEIVFARLLEEKGRQDLVGFVWNGLVQHRFAFCCGYDLADWSGFLGLFKGLRDAVRADEGLDWDEWKAAALHHYKEDMDRMLTLTDFGERT